MAETNIAPLVDIPIDGKHTISSINCVVCKKSRCFTKYHRHLSSHVKAGELTADDANKILFSCRVTRSDIKSSQDKAQRGYTCRFKTDTKDECGRIVMDLKRHSTSVHKLDKFCSLFEDLIEIGFSEKPVKRKIHITTHTQSKQNDSCGKKICLSQDMDNSITCNQIQPTSSHSTQKPLHTEDTFAFESETDSDSDPWVLESTTFCPSREDYSYNLFFVTSPSIGLTNSNLTSLQSLDTEKIFKEFQSFMQTKGGGGRRNTPVKGDVSSFRCLINKVGWGNLWNQNVLNDYITSASCSPSISYRRLRVYERFIRFLRSRFPNLLPPPEHLSTVESMIKALKEALGKDRHYRSRLTMTSSRNRMPHSLSVLRQWRLERKTVGVKSYFPISTDDDKFILDESLFYKLRNYLIVELILNNAQRSGIIEGMRIREVLEARNNANENSLHYMYVQEHKTGHIQPAIIYLDLETYRHLLIFVLVVIPQLPQLDSLRSDDDSRVFQA